MASSMVPKALKAKTTDELARLIAKVQAAEHGKVSIVSIYYDTGSKEHVCWYLPIMFGGQVF